MQLTLYTYSTCILLNPILASWIPKIPSTKYMTVVVLRVRNMAMDVNTSPGLSGCPVAYVKVVNVRKLKRDIEIK